jgi:small subunit ribosomal protein S16
MLSIRMQRLGRKGYPTYRVVVQDSHQSPTSGKYVALLGNYNPHNKEANLVKEKAEFYLKHGAQPSDRVVTLFKSEKIALPKWVKESTEQKREIRNPEKLRKNQPEKPAEEKPVEDKPAEDEQKPAEEIPTEKEQKEEEKPEPAGQKPEETKETSEDKKPEAEQKSEEKPESESKK